jgi:hypothetical protein
VPLEQKELAETASVAADWLSRRGGLVVQCPWGLVPIEFFWWKKPTSTEFLRDATRHAMIMVRNGDGREPTSIAREAVLKVAGTTAKVRSQDVNGLSKLVPELRLVAAGTSMVLAHRAKLPRATAKMLKDALGLKRGEWVAAMALCGVFDEELA